jgi:hypothetical protein
MRSGFYRCDTLPDFLLNYLDAASLSIQELFGNPEVNNIPQRITDALAFKRAGQGIRSDAFSEFDKASRDRMLVVRVGREKRLNPTRPLDTIVADMAEREQVGEGVVWAAWSAWKDLFLSR